MVAGNGGLGCLSAAEVFGLCDSINCDGEVGPLPLGKGGNYCQGSYCKVFHSCVVLDLCLGFCFDLISVISDALL